VRPLYLSEKRLISSPILPLPAPTFICLLESPSSPLVSSDSSVLFSSSSHLSLCRSSPLLSSPLLSSQCPGLELTLSRALTWILLSSSRALTHSSPPFILATCSGVYPTYLIRSASTHFIRSRMTSIPLLLSYFGPSYASSPLLSLLSHPHTLHIPLYSLLPCPLLSNPKNLPCFWH